METTDVSTSSLQPNTVEHLKEGIACDNVDAARELVDRYREEGSSNGKSSESESSSSSSAQSSSTQQNDANKSASSQTSQR